LEKYFCDLKHINKAATRPTAPGQKLQVFILQLFYFYLFPTI